MAQRHRLHPVGDWVALGERLREARLKAGLTQGEVAGRFGRDQSFVAKVERGERQVTALEFRDLCRLYRVSGDSILQIDI